MRQGQDFDLALIAAALIAVAGAMAFVCYEAATSERCSEAMPEPLCKLLGAQ